MPNQDTARIRFRNTSACEILVPVVPGCVMGLQRTLLEQLGGFAEDVGCTDDMDLCIRAYFSGVTIKRIDKAILHYRLRDSRRALFWQRFAYGLSWAALYKKYRRFGMQRRTFTQLGRDFRTLLIGSFGDHSAHVRAIATIGMMLGRIRGCLKYRVAYP
jgi:GT2 family glycosyltransferase